MVWWCKDWVISAIWDVLLSKAFHTGPIAAKPPSSMTVQSKVQTCALEMHHGVEESFKQEKAMQPVESNCDSTEIKKKCLKLLGGKMSFRVIFPTTNCG